MIDFEVPDNFRKFIVEVENRKMYVSEQVLCLASPVFRSMLTHNFKEKGEGKVALCGKQFEPVKLFMTWLHIRGYCLNGDDVYLVLPLSHEYAVDQLKTECESILIRRLNRILSDSRSSRCSCPVWLNCDSSNVNYSTQFSTPVEVTNNDGNGSAQLSSRSASWAHFVSSSSNSQELTPEFERLRLQSSLLTDNQFTSDRNMHTTQSNGIARTPPNNTSDSFKWDYRTDNPDGASSSTNHQIGDAPAITPIEIEQYGDFFIENEEDNEDADCNQDKDFKSRENRLRLLLNDMCYSAVFHLPRLSLLVGQHLPDYINYDGLRARPEWNDLPMSTRYRLQDSFLMPKLTRCIAGWTSPIHKEQRIYPVSMAALQTHSQHVAFRPGWMDNKVELLVRFSKTPEKILHFHIRAAAGIDWKGPTRVRFAVEGLVINGSMEDEKDRRFAKVAKELICNKYFDLASPETREVGVLYLDDIIGTIYKQDAFQRFVRDYFLLRVSFKVLGL